MATGCSGDCASDYLSRHALNNGARKFGISATSTLASNPDLLNRNINLLIPEKMMGMSEKFTIHAADLGSINATNVGASDTTNTVADVAGPTVDRLASGAHRVVDQMADVAAQAAEALDAKGGELKNLQVQWLEKSRVYVRDNPVKSLGIAIVSGFLLSRLLSSR